MSQSTEDLLNASRSPSIAPDTSGRRPGVRRLNNIPIYIVGGVVLGFALLIALVAATKGQQSAGQAQQFHPCTCSGLWTQSAEGYGSRARSGL